MTLSLVLLKKLVLNDTVAASSMIHADEETTSNRVGDQIYNCEAAAIIDKRDLLASIESLMYSQGQMPEPIRRGLRCYQTPSSASPMKPSSVSRRLH